MHKSDKEKGKMNNRGKGIAMAALALAALSMGAFGTANAQGPEGGPGMGPHRPPMERAMGARGDHGRWWNSPHAIESLKLTEAQRKAMDDIYQQNRLTLVDLHANLEKAELTMEPLMQADAPDEGKILAQIDRVAQARAELEKANARMLLGLRKQLTPEQWKQIQTDRASLRDGHGPMGSGMGPGQQKWRHGGPGGPAAGGSGTPGSGAPPPPDGPAGPGLNDPGDVQ